MNNKGYLAGLTLLFVTAAAAIAYPVFDLPRESYETKIYSDTRAKHLCHKFHTSGLDQSRMLWAHADDNHLKLGMKANADTVFDGPLSSPQQATEKAQDFCKNAILPDGRHLNNLMQ